MTNVKKHLPLICCALGLSFTFCLYAPIELFLINRKDFVFGLLTFLWMPILFSLAVFVLCVLFGLIFYKKPKWETVYTSLLFGATLSIYIQGNYLNMAIGTMNGKEINWDLYRQKMLIHLVIFLVVFIAVQVFFAIKPKLAKKVGMYASILLVLMQLVAFVSLMIPAINDGKGVRGVNAVFTGDGLYEIGDGGDIIVFVLDSYDGSYFAKVLEEEPDFGKELPGFTYYANYSGTNYETQYGLIPYVAGQLYLNQAPYAEWVEGLAEERMFYDELLDNGYDLGVYLSNPDVIPERIKGEALSFKEVPLKFKDNFAAFKHLYRMVSCKYLPDIIKPYIWLHGTEFEGMVYSEEAGELFSPENADFIAGLENGGLTVDAGKKSYRLMHLFGAHAPYDLDRNGNPTTPVNDESQIGRGAIEMVKKYMDEMKKNGIYDNSTIIITADHGNQVYDAELTNPVFLLKPAGEAGDFNVSDAPVWPCDFAATIAQLAGSANYADYGTSVLDVTEGANRERFMYSYVYGNVHTNISLHKNGIRNLVEYSVPSDAADPMRYELTGREFLPTGEIIDHMQYCETCKNHVSRDNSKGYVTWMHTAADDHPLMCDCESWW